MITRPCGSGNTGLSLQRHASYMPKRKEADMREGKGQHRKHGASGAPNTVYVTDRSISFEIAEMLYRERGYLPAFDELPWAGGPDA